MARNYQVNTNDGKEIFAYDVVFIDYSNTKPIGAGIIGEDWVFFYKVNPPVVWDDISASVKRDCIISFSQVN